MIKLVKILFLLLPISLVGQDYSGGNLYVTLGLGKCSACDYFHWLEEWSSLEGVKLKYVLPSIKDEAGLILSEEYLYMSFKDSAEHKKNMVLFDDELFKLAGGGVKTSILLLNRLEKEIFKGDVQHFPFKKSVPRITIDTIYEGKKSLPSFLWNMPVFINQNLFYIHNRKNDELFLFNNNQQKGLKQQPSPKCYTQLLNQLTLSQTDIKRQKFEVGDARYHATLNSIYVLGTYTIELTSKKEIFQPVIWVIHFNDAVTEEMYLFNNKLLNENFYVRLTQMIPVGHSLAILENGNLVLSIYSPSMLRFTGEPAMEKAPVLAEFSLNKDSNDLKFINFIDIYLPLFKIKNKEGYFNFTSNPISCNNKLYMLFYQEVPVVFNKKNDQEINFINFFNEQIENKFKLVYMNYDIQNNHYIYITQDVEKLDNEIFIFEIKENTTPVLKVRQNLSIINPTFGTDEHDSSIIITSINSSKDLVMLRLKVEW